MPIRYERDDARRRVVVTVEGPFKPDDFVAVIERWRSMEAAIRGSHMVYRGNR